MGDSKEDGEKKRQILHATINVERNEELELFDLKRPNAEKSGSWAVLERATLREDLRETVVVR